MGLVQDWSRFPHQRNDHWFHGWLHLFNWESLKQILRHNPMKFQEYWQGCKFLFSIDFPRVFGNQIIFKYLIEILTHPCLFFGCACVILHYEYAHYIMTTLSTHLFFHNSFRFTSTCSLCSQYAQQALMVHTFLHINCRTIQSFQIHINDEMYEKEKNDVQKEI